MTGVQREPPGEIWESMEPPSREELIAGLEDAELVLRPGEQWHYSNLVFALLGEIVMRATGEPYADVLQRRILDPLGLTRTSLRPEAPKASPYYVDPYTEMARDEPDPGGDGVDGRRRAGSGRPRPTSRAGARSSPTGNDDGAAEGGARPDGAPAGDGRRGALDDGLGARARLFRRGDRVLVGHDGAMPGFLAGLVVHRARAHRCRRSS